MHSILVLLSGCFLFPIRAAACISLVTPATPDHMKGSRQVVLDGLLWGTATVSSASCCKPLCSEFYEGSSVERLKTLLQLRLQLLLLHLLLRNPRPASQMCALYLPTLAAAGCWPNCHAM